MGYESSLERDFVTLMRFDPLVASVESQPVRIHFEDSGGIRRSYVPDYLVRFEDRAPLLAEVKYEEDLERNREALAPRFQVAGSYAQDRDWRFEVWSEKRIRTPHLSLAALLLPWRSKDYDTGMGAHLIARVRKGSALTVDELMAPFRENDSDCARAARALRCLLARRVLLVDMGAPLTGESEVRLG